MDDKRLQARVTGRQTERQISEYHKGWIAVRFRHAKYDWLQMQVRSQAHGTTIRYLDETMSEVGTETFGGRRDRLSCRFSSVWCPFPDMIRWLEAITTGVQSCAFDWDAEGPCGKVEWDHNDLCIRWPWRSTDERVLSVHADRRQVVRAFYTAFRRFVESPEYHPERYEGMYLCDDRSAVVPGLDYQGFGRHLRPMRSKMVEDWLG